jgi:hypothetical protein
MNRLARFEAAAPAETVIVSAHLGIKAHVVPNIVMNLVVIGESFRWKAPAMYVTKFELCF